MNNRHALTLDVHGSSSIGCFAFTTILYMSYMWDNWMINTILHFMNENITYAAFHKCCGMRHMRGWMDISSFKMSSLSWNLDKKRASYNQNTFFDVLNIMDENITYTAYHECWDMRHMRGWMDISVSFQTTPLSWNLDKLWISYNQNTSFDVFNIMDENITYAACHKCWEMWHMRGWMDISVSFQTTH